LLTNTAIIAAGLALAGGAAYGLVPGELGHHGAQIVNVAAPRELTPASLLSHSYRPPRGATAGHPGIGPNPGVVYVDGKTPSEGPSMVSVAHPSKSMSVLATRGLDGHCTFLRVHAATAEVTSAALESCAANAAPKRGWSPYHG
jgi:hypothetical protein